MSSFFFFTTLIRKSKITPIFTHIVVLARFLIVYIVGTESIYYFANSLPKIVKKKRQIVDNKICLTTVFLTDC